MSRSESTPILNQLHDHLNRYFPSGGRMILGVSGGPDSMCLLYLFSKLDVDLTVVHCNYQLRGEASDKDQELVEDTASMWGFDTVSTRLDPLDSRGRNFQNWARNRRYRIFRDLKEELNADAIVTAHHQDDQLETVIQKILRGAGLTAWQGMKVWTGELFRPLLNVSKAEILRFASANHIPYRLDSSNEESTYARNFLRNGWFPVLDDLFPGWRENILKVPERAREHEAVIESLIRSLMPGQESVDRERLIALSPEVRKPLILQILKKADPAMAISSGALSNLERIETLQTGRKIEINERWSLLRDRDRFVIQQEGEAEFSEVQLDRMQLEKREQVLGNVALSLEAWDGSIRPDELQIDADRVEWPVFVRNWKQGDEINPFGMKGTQNVSDLLTNNKISSAQRADAKVLEASDGTLVCVLFPEAIPSGKIGSISEGVRCTKDTDEVLVVRLS